MGDDNNRVKRCIVSYPAHMLKPEDLICFYETATFRSSWADAGMNDDDLLTLQVGIMLNPTGGSVIPATNGLRKLRFARGQDGKRGGLRVCYVYFEQASACLLVLAYAKNVKLDLTGREKAVIREMITEQQQMFRADE